MYVALVAPAKSIVPDRVMVVSAQREYGTSATVVDACKTFTHNISADVRDT